MDAAVGISIGKLVDAAMAGQKEEIAAYAKQISQLFKASGDKETAKRIMSSIKGASSRTASLSRGAKVSNRPVPVDADSRLSLADEIQLQSEPVVVTSSLVDRTVSRFLESHANADRLAEHGLSVPNSMLLYGPPGCGKTILAKKIAYRLGLPILLARSDSLISSYLGNTAKNVRALFDYAASKPCILFLDEIDSLAKMRDDERELGELKRVVISLLENIDASQHDFIMLAATNHEHLLDPAVWRRFTTTVHVARPSVEARAKLLRTFFGSAISEAQADVLACMANDFSCAALKQLSEEIIRDAVLLGSGSVETPRAINLFFEQQNITFEDGVPEAICRIRDAVGKKLTQKQLGDMFGISQSQVSRILLERERANE